MSYHPPPIATDADEEDMKFFDSPPSSPNAVHLPPVATPTSPSHTQAYLAPHPSPWGAWSQADYTTVFVRGPTYLRSNHKIAARQPMMDCVELEVLTSRQRLENAAGRAGSPLQRLNSEHRGTAAAGAQQLAPFDPSFTFVVNFMVPLKNEDGVYVVAYFKHRHHNLSFLAAPPQRPSAHLNEQQVAVQSSGQYADTALETTARAAYVSAFSRFVSGDTHYRDAHLKFIPHLVEGSWMVKKAVGTKPAVIGNKLKQTYVSSAALNYLEVDIDVCSSKVAANVFSVVKKAARELVIDMFYTVEGQDEQALPEVLLAACRLIKIDSAKAVRV